MFKNVLVFPSTTEIGVEVFDALKNNKHFVPFGGTGIEKGTTLVPINIDLPFITDYTFINELNRVCEEWAIDYIYPTNDDVSLFLAQNEDKIPRKIVGFKTIVNFICRDKELTYKMFKDKLNIPITYSYEKRYSASLPLFIKPKIGSSSKDCHKFDWPNEFEKFLKDKDHSKYLLSEYLPGKEYTIDCVSQNGLLKFVGARKSISRKMGISDVCVVEDNQRFLETARIISKEFNLTGCWFFQMKENDKGNLKLLEIGPRLSGGCSFWRYMGVNLVEINLWLAGNHDVGIKLNDIEEEIVYEKYLTPRVKLNDDSYDNIYVDFDDTLILDNKKLNYELAGHLLKWYDKGKKIILLSKTTNDYMGFLETYGLQKIFTEFIIIDAKSNKADFIEENSILIDDSHAERFVAQFLKNVIAFDLTNYQII